MYPCANGINNGTYAYNNLQMFDNTWYHKFNASWHMATEAWYMYQRGVPSVSDRRARKRVQRRVLCRRRNPLPRAGMGGGQLRRKAGQREKLFSIRSDFLDDMKGQRTGYKTRYTEETLMWGHWVGSTVLFRPELRFDHALDRRAYDNGTRRTSSSWRWT